MVRRVWRLQFEWPLPPQRWQLYREGHFMDVLFWRSTTQTYGDETETIKGAIPEDTSVEIIVQEFRKCIHS